MQRSNSFASFLIALALLVTSCTTKASPSPTSQRTPLVNTPSHTSTPTEMTATAPPASPSPPSILTPIPSASPTLPIPSQGPYFAYMTDEDSLVLHLLAPDAQGSAEMRLPTGATTHPCLSCVISPDAAWLAFWTGSLHEPGEPADGEYTLSLGLLSLTDGSAHMISNLLSDDYPMNFQANAASLSAYLGQEPESLAQELEWAFNIGIRVARWSPKGRYLAFAGEMDGPSSDLYLYDTQRATVRRLSSGRESIMGIDWSPDGQFILQSSAYYIGQGSDFTFHATTPDGSESRSFDLHGFFGGWLSPGRLFSYQAQNGPGTFGLAVTDIATAESHMVWPDSFEEYAYDPLNGSLLLGSPGPFFAPDGPEAGLYFMPASTWAPRMLTQGWDWNVAFMGAPEAPFVAAGGDIGTAFVSSHGVVTSFSDRSFRPYPSPDQKSIALVGSYPENPIWLYQVGGELTEVTPTSRTFLIHWQPDSSAFFFVSDGNPYFLGCENTPLPPIDSNLIQ